MRRLLIVLVGVSLFMPGLTASAYWSAASASGGHGAAAASSVGQGATPTASVDGHAVTVSWAPTILATGRAVDGYAVTRYSGSTVQPILTACDGVVAATSCVESDVPTGEWTYAVTPLFATYWHGVESPTSSTVVVVDPGLVAVGDGSSVTTEAMTTAAVVDPAPATSEPAAQTTVTVASDTTGPSGGSVDVSGLIGTGSRYAPSLTLALVLAKGTDPDGLATAGDQLLRASASLDQGICGAFGTYTVLNEGVEPGPSASDAVVDQFCYSYRYVVLDTLGNSTAYTSSAVAVDRTAPTTPVLGFQAGSNTYWAGSGTTVYVRSDAVTGSFDVRAHAADPESGIVSYAIAPLGANWTSTSGGLGVTTYTWSGAPASPGIQNVTATNNAGIVSTPTSFTVTVDNTSPVGSTVSYLGGATAGTSVLVTFADGTDGGSGIGLRLLQRAVATRTDGACGDFGVFATVLGGTDPTSPVNDAVSEGHCYAYQYVVSDHVGNTRTASSASIATT